MFPSSKPLFRQKALLLHFLPWALLLYLCYPVLRNLYRSRWDYIDYTHAYFILPVSLWLVWHNRQNLRVTAAQRSMSGADLAMLGVLLFGLSVFTFAWRQDYVFLSTLAFIPVLFGISGFVYGSYTAKALSFPIMYLLFLVPPPLGILDSVTLPMRYGVSIATDELLKLFHNPVTREGLLLSISGHEVYLGEPCSGFRSLITLSSLGLAYIYLSKGGLAKKCVMAFSIVPLTLLGNLIRVVSVVLFTHYFGENQAQRFYHDFSGFAIFLFMIGGLLWIEKAMKNK